MRRRRRRPPASSGGSRATATQATAAPETAPPESQAHYDEGVQLLRAALDQVSGRAPAPVEPPTSPSEPPAARSRRRAGNGNGHGNGHGNGGSTETIPAKEDAEGLDEAESVEDASELDREPDHVAARRRWVARSRKRARTRNAPPPEAAGAIAPAHPETETTAARDDAAAAPALDDAQTDADVQAAETAEPEAPAEAEPETPAEAEPETPAEAEPETPAEAEVQAPAEAEAEPALEPVPVEPVAAPPTLARPAPPRPAPRRRRRERVAVAVTVAVVLAATGVLAAVTLSDRGGDDGAGGSAAAGPAELTFDTISLAPGATVERAWSLAGNEGSRFEGTLTFANTTGERIAVSHTEVIPKSLAASVDDIAFEPAPVVIEADPVVRFDVDIPADGTATATYRIDVAPDGADESRLEDWADDLETEEARQADSTTTTSTTTRPTTTTTPPTTTTKPPSGGGGSGGGAGGGTSPKSGGGSSGGNLGGSPAATPPVSGQPPPPPHAPPPPPPTDGLIVVRALSLEGTGTFGFSGPSGSVQITTAGGPNGSGQWATGVAAGTYSWTEVALPAGWRLSNVDCSDRDAGPFELRSTVSGATATFNVQPGETVLCTWTNRKV